MLPCKKRAFGRHAARYLKRAESLARKIKIGRGVKREIIDGCIVEGRRAGRLLTASSIEAPSQLLGMMANVNFEKDERRDLKYKKEFVSLVTDSTPYRPGTELIPDAPLTHDGTNVVPFTKSIYVGTPPVFAEYKPYSVTYGDMPPGGSHSAMIVPPGIGHGEHHILSVMHTESEGLHQLTMSFITKTDHYRLAIGSEFIKAACDGYGTSDVDLRYFARKTSIIETGYGKATVVFNASKEIHEWQDTKLYSERLVRLDIDLKLPENNALRSGEDYNKDADWIEPGLVFAVFPDSLIPPDLLSGTVIARAAEDAEAAVPAMTAMSVADLALGEDGEVLAAIKWEVKQQSGTDPNRYYWTLYSGDNQKRSACWGTGVAAFGLAAWGGGKQFFNIHSREVFTPNGSDPLVALHGADADVALHGERMLIFNGKVHRWVMLRERSTLESSIVNGSGRVGFVEPYTAELIDGVLQKPQEFGDIVYAGSGVDYPPGAAIKPGNSDFYISADWTREAVRDAKCMVSSNTMAMAAGGDVEFVSENWIRSTGQGIGFFDGNRRRYEQLTGNVGVPQNRVITVTCHQREVRDQQGNITTPSVIIVGCLFNNKPSVLIRKGPVWEEDMPEPYNFSDYWTVFDAANYSYNFFFYRGSPLIAGLLGSMFITDSRGA